MGDVGIMQHDSIGGPELRGRPMFSVRAPTGCAGILQSGGIHNLGPKGGPESLVRVSVEHTGNVWPGLFISLGSVKDWQAGPKN